MVTPTPDGLVSPLGLAAAALAGLDEVWRLGGAQAIAELVMVTPTRVVAAAAEVRIAAADDSTAVATAAKAIAMETAISM